MTKEEYLNSDFVTMLHLNNQVVSLSQKNKKLEKENEQLKAQIEKMKLCENCKHSYHDRYHTLLCMRNCINFDNWELVE